MNKKLIFYLIILTIAFLANLVTGSNLFIHKLSSFMNPTCDKTDLKFSTEESQLPKDLKWKQISFGKELINILQGVVVIAGGNNEISQEKWKNFKPIFPWVKNINRNLLFNKSAFIRSPKKNVNCDNECVTVRNYKGYTWVDLAEPVCVTFIPSKTNMLKPAQGHLVVKTIRKCHAIYFEDSFYQLTDNKGNFYAMHAFENDQPNTDVVLPEGWSIKKVTINEPLIIGPFGGGDYCYHNVIGDHLGQGYHQYKFLNKYFP